MFNLKKKHIKMYDIPELKSIASQFAHAESGQMLPRVQNETR